MILYSTEHKSPNVSLEEAIFRGLPPDNGLYMPTEIKPLPASFFETIQDRTLPEIAIAVCENLLGDSLTSAEIKKISRAKKVTVIKYKAKSNYFKKRGHRHRCRHF